VVVVLVLVLVCMYAHSAVSGDSIGGNSSLALSEFQILSIAIL